MEAVTETIPTYIKRSINHPDNSYTVTLTCSIDKSLINPRNTLVVVYNNALTTRSRTDGTVTLKASLKDQHDLTVPVVLPQSNGQPKTFQVLLKSHLDQVFDTILVNWCVENLYYDGIHALAPVVDATPVHDEAEGSIVNPDDGPATDDTIVAAGRPFTGPVLSAGEVGRIDPSQSSTQKDWKHFSILEAGSQPKQ